MLQVTNPKSLRKLKARIDEVPEVSKFLYSVYNGEQVLETAVTELLTMKKVKENGNMVSLLQEIQEYLKVPNLDAAKATVKRVFEVQNAPAGIRPVPTVPDLTFSANVPDTEQPVTEKFE